MAEATKSVKWMGGEGYRCFALSEHGLPSLLEVGKTYKLPATLADSLVRSHKDWQLAKEPKSAKAEKIAADAAESDDTPDEGATEPSEH